MEQPSPNGEQKLAGPTPGIPGLPGVPGLPLGGDASALAALCWAAGVLLDRAPAPVSWLRVRCGEVSVEMRWPSSQTAASQAPPPTPAAPAGSAAPEAPELAYVRAPMVGTYYHAPSPDAPPFVKPGDVVEAGQQVGIVEAMKLMNAVEADRPGRVVEVVAANAAAVEFDQPLVALAPLTAVGELEETLRCSPPS